LSKGQGRANRIVCENNLQQIGIAFISFSHDHNGKFPMQVPTADGGSEEFVQSGYLAGGQFYFGFHSFQAMSGELLMPQILICPADTRLAATNFAALKNGNISYFAGVNADFNNPNSILAGDRNLGTNSVQTPTILRIDARSRLHWTQELHQFKGNVLFADGHVEEWNNSALASAANNPSATANLFLPSTPSGANMAADSMPDSNQNFGSGAGTSSTASFAGSLGTSSNAVTHLTATPLEENQSNRPPGIAYRSNKPFYKNQTAPTGQESSSATTQSVPVPSSVSSGGVADSDDTDFMMSPFNRRLARLLQCFIVSSYLLLLLLLLLFLAYKLWRRLQKWKEEKQMAELKRMAQETVLDSDKFIS
jgi:prepilin-type processing-associated H-X9-DG protein